jgi:hypothetical protein
MLPEEGDRRLRRLPLARLRLLLGHLLLQRWLLAAGHLVLLAQQALAEGVADVADVEGLLLERPLRLEHPLLELRPPAWAVEEAAERQRLLHRACWAASSWWRTNHQRTAHDPNLTPVKGVRDRALPVLQILNELHRQKKQIG